MKVVYKGFNAYMYCDKAVYTVNGKQFESRIYTKLVNDTKNGCKLKRQYFFYVRSKKLIIDNIYTEQFYNI